MGVTFSTKLSQHNHLRIGLWYYLVFFTSLHLYTILYLLYSTHYTALGALHHYTTYTTLHPQLTPGPRCSGGGLRHREDG